MLWIRLRTLVRGHYYFFFFFSSRRRHTRYWRDWSSDVCSSDLGRHAAQRVLRREEREQERSALRRSPRRRLRVLVGRPRLRVLAHAREGRERHRADPFEIGRAHV